MDHRNMKRKGEGEGEASSSKKGRPRKYKDGEEKRQNKITSDQRCRIKTKAREKRSKKLEDYLSILMDSLTNFFQILSKISNTQELKTELEKLHINDVKIQCDIESLQSENQGLNTENEKLHGEKQMCIDAYIQKYKITDSKFMKEHNEKRKLQCKNAKLRESIRELQNQYKESIRFFLEQHLIHVHANLTEEFKKLPDIWVLKWEFRRLEDEKEELEAEHKELLEEIGGLKLIEEKLKEFQDNNPKPLEIKGQFERNLRHEQWRIEDVHDGLEVEIKWLKMRNELLACIKICDHSKRPIEFPVQNSPWMSHLFSPLPPPGNSEDFAEWMQDFQLPENNCPPDNINVPYEQARENGVCYACKCVEYFMTDQLKDKKNGYKLSDFRNYDGQGWMMKHENIFPLHLDYIHKGIGRDVTKNTTMNNFIVTYSRALFYAVIDEMHNMKLVDIDHDVMEKWGVIIKEALRLDLDVEFAEVHLKKIAHAYFSKNELQPNLERLISTSEQELVELQQRCLEKERLLTELKEKQRIICKPEETETFDNDSRLSAGIL